MTDDTIYAVSDVARDILQNSEYFTSVGKAVGEYVWNSVDYCRRGSSVEVHIDLKRGRVPIRAGGEVKYNGLVIEERKNGGGMSLIDLRRFFTMHGKTLAREQGRHVRGRYGTGKAAAFGIAKTLIVESVKDGWRNVLRLNIEDLEGGSDRVPITSLLTNQPSKQENGTTIIIDRLKLKKVKMESARKFLRRSLGPQLRNHAIYVSDEKLEYTVPPFEREWTYQPDPARQTQMGKPSLVLRYSTKDLEEEDQGVVIMANNYPLEFYESRRGGRWANRIFGEVDVPLLDSNDAIPAFDNTRGAMNRENERVATLLSWIDDCITQASSHLETEARAKLDKEEMRRLEEIATELANMLNEDFALVMDELETTPVIGGTGPLVSGVQLGSAGAKTYLKGPDGTQGVKVNSNGEIIIQEAKGGSGKASTANPDEPTRGELDRDGEKAKEGVTKGEKRKPRGGFSIKFSNDGPEAFRAKMVSELQTIFINLDYPEFAVFKNHQDPRFRALANEVAVAEYAIATVNIMVKRGHVDVVDTAADALIEYNRIVNRMGRKIAQLMPRWYGFSEGFSTNDSA